MSETQSETAPQSPPEDLRASLNAAFDQTESAPPLERQAPDKAPSAEPVASPTDTTEGATERARGPDGKFVANNAEPVAPAPETKPAEPVEVKPTFGEELTKATARWAQPHKDMLAKLPEDAQKFLVERHRDMEADHTRKTTEIANLRRDWEPVAQMFTPHADLMRQKGLTPQSMIGAWYNVERGLMSGGQQAADIVAGIVNGYNIDRATLGRMLGFQTSHAPTDPPAPVPENGAATQVPPEVAQKLGQMEAWIRQQEQQSRDRERAAYVDKATTQENEIAQFAQATDSAGALLHPHFEDVKADMAYHAQVMWASGRPPVLSELYDQAVRANPATYAKLIASERAAWEAQRATEEKQRQDAARAKATQARRAASSVTGAPGAGQAAVAGNGSLRSQLEATFDEVSASV